MTTSDVNVQISVTESAADAERLDELTARLMHDLRDIGAESVERPVGEAAPEGARGDPFTLGALALAVLPAILPKLLDFLQSWASRDKGRSVKVKTASGLEVEFTPEKRYSEDDLLALAKKLSQATAG